MRLHTCAVARALVLLTASSVALAAQPAQLRQVFPARVYDSPGANGAAVFADLDGDGKTDVIDRDFFGTLNWSRAGEELTFSAALPLGPTKIYRCHAARDADLDGDLDLYLQGDPGTTQLQLWRNDSTGAISMAAGLDLPGWYLHSVEVEDLNGDLFPDVAVSNSDYFAPGQVWTCLSPQFAGFGTPTSVGPSGWQLVLGDFDGSGSLDILIASQDVPTRLHLNDGAGAFGPELVLAQKFPAHGIRVADFDLDGRVDVVFIAALYSAQIALSGGPAVFFPPWTLPSNVLTDWIDVHDVDVDGRPDILVGGMAGVQVLLNSTPGFSTADFWPISVDSTALTDNDGDGELEFLLAESKLASWGHEPTLRVLAASSKGVYAPYADIASYSAGDHRLACSDLNADGNADLVLVKGKLAWPIDVRLGHGDGSFSTVNAGVVNAAEIALADADADGRADLIASEMNGVHLSFRKGLGDGTFGAPVLSYSGIAGPEFLDVADYDGDGRIDVCIGREGTQIAHGLGNGQFAPASLLAGALYGARPDRAADLNGDGFLDPLVHASHTTIATTVQWWPSNGAGGYASVQGLPSALVNARVVAGDFNADGHPDIAHPISEHAVEVRYGDGHGGWLQTQQVDLAWPGSPVISADFDLDGFDDLILGSASANMQSATTSLLHGAAIGSQAPMARYEGPIRTRAVVLDVDGDARLDLVTDAGALLRNPLRDFTGAQAFGTGTWGCAGMQTLAGSRAPHVGASDFRLVCHAAPPQAFGIGLVGALMDSGSDPFGIGLVLHVGFNAPFVPFEIASSVSGSASRSVPIPSDTQLAGVQLFAQIVWPWSASASCDPSPLSLSSTRGLALTIQP
jgi:hypothetical protein